MRRAHIGATLIECLVGLGVAAIVATVAMVSLSMAGIASMRHATRMRSGDAAWLALAAIARDLADASRWEGCDGTIACTAATSHRGPAALVVTIGGTQVSWFSEDSSLVRCDATCETYLTGVARASFLADVPRRDGNVRRTWLAAAHENRALAIEVRLTMTNGRSFARVVGRRRAR